MRRDELRKYSKEQLIDIVEALEQRVAELEARVNAPRKTPRNSSTPPSQGEKPNRSKQKSKPRKSKKGGHGCARALEPEPDRSVTVPADQCPGCGGEVEPERQKLTAVYDRIELPRVRPDVTRVYQYQGACPCCGEAFAARPPAGLEPGSPFGTSVQEMIIYLHTMHAVSFSRLAVLMKDLFGLTISEGAIANILARAKGRFDRAVRAITGELRRAAVIGCDETSARVAGRTFWQWVFGCSSAVLHHVAPSRSKQVVRDVLGGHVPEVWVSDRYPGQGGHAADRQVCLAHLLRDVQYAIDAGETVFAPPAKRLLLRAVAIGRRRPDLRDSTLYQYRCRLERDLDRLLAQTPDTDAGLKLRRQLLRVRAHLFTFATDRRVPYTNNASERYLRPAVIFRKVTQGFRATWGADFYAGVRSAVDTGSLNGLPALTAIRRVLADQPILSPQTP